MVVDVDLDTDPPAVALTDPGDCTRFHVAVHGQGGRGRVDALLRSSGVGSVDGDEAVIGVEAVRTMAGRRDPGWEADFGAMLEFAKTKGWLTDDGAGIRAHIVAD